MTVRDPRPVELGPEVARGRTGRLPVPTACRTAVGAAMGLVLLLGSALALGTAPWTHPDEKAHGGYVRSLAHGRLPDVDTRIEVLEGATNLEWVLALARPTPDGEEGRTKVWVANHPPGAYVPALAGSWSADRSGNGDDVVRWLRLANVTGAALVVGFSALLARELSGTPRAGVVAAGVVALTPHLSGMASTGLTDGFSTAALAAVTWASTRAVRRGFEGDSVAPVALAAAACGLTRISSLAVAAVVVALALAITWRRARRAPWRPALIIGVAVTVTSGWFYVRNTARYGDPAGSSALMDRFGREPVGSWFDALTRGGQWDHTLRTLFASYRGNPSTPGVRTIPPHDLISTGALVVLALALVAVAADLWRRTPQRGRSERDRRRPDRAGWLLLGAAVATAFATTARHVSVGGYAHARYLFVVVVAAGCVLGHVAAGPRGARFAGLAGVVPVLALLAVHARLLPGLLADAAWDLPGIDARLGSPGARWALLVGAAVAALGYLAAAARCLRAPSSPPRSS